MKQFFLEKEMTTPVKEKKPFSPSLWQQHLAKVIEEKKGSGMKLGEITKLASQTYTKQEPVKQKLAKASKKDGLPP